MSQFAQAGMFPGQPFGQGQQMQPQGQFPMQGQQGFGQQQQMPTGPQLPQMPINQSYAPGQFPWENSITMVGQIFPNQWIPAGISAKPTRNGSGIVLNINVKVRKPGTDKTQPSVQFVRLIAFGQLAQQLQNGLKAGQIIRFTGEFQPNRYKNPQTGKVSTNNQITLHMNNNQMPIQVIGELPLIEEIQQPRQQGWNGGGQFNQQPMAQFPQQQQFPQQMAPAPMAQQAFPQQAMPQQQPMQQMQPPFAQPPAGFPAPNQPVQGYPSAGAPTPAPAGQMAGNFAPPPGMMQATPQAAPQQAAPGMAQFRPPGSTFPV